MGDASRAARRPFHCQCCSLHEYRCIGKEFLSRFEAFLSSERSATSDSSTVESSRTASKTRGYHGVSLVQACNGLEVEFEVLTISVNTCSLGQTAISLGRAAGPVIGGSIWSWSLQNGYHAPLDSHFLVSQASFAVSSHLADTTGCLVSSRARPRAGAAR